MTDIQTPGEMAQKNIELQTDAHWDKLKIKQMVKEYEVLEREHDACQAELRKYKEKALCRCIATCSVLEALGE